MKKRTIQIVLTLLLSALALYIALHGIDFKDVGTALSKVSWPWVIVTLALILVTLLIRAQRWRILLGRTLSLQDTFGLIGIGYLISGVLPLRAGDPARAVGASVRGPVTALTALSTVVVERVLDMLLIVLILLATLPFVPGLQSYLAEGQVNEFLSFNLVLALSGILAFGILLAFVLIAIFPLATERFARGILQRLGISDTERWLRPVQGVVQGLSALRSPKDGLAIVLWSVVLWGVTTAYFATMMWGSRAFLPETSILMSLVAVWSSAFGMVFPATGGIGSFHFAVREALYWGFDVSRDLGFAYAVLVHALPYLTGIALGALILVLWGISLKSLVNRGQEIEASAPD
ncbi:MAG: lysylphosphatidylglycerol synthase transmembrane domain-containing protein [Anaerolineae bacterium]